LRSCIAPELHTCMCWPFHHGSAFFFSLSRSLALVFSSTPFWNLSSFGGRPFCYPRSTKADLPEPTPGPVDPFLLGKAARLPRHFLSVPNLEDGQLLLLVSNLSPSPGRTSRAVVLFCPGPLDLSNFGPQRCLKLEGRL